MKVIKDLAHWHKLRNEIASKEIGLVPTMGAIHKGHLSLIEKCVSENEIAVVTIFLNPTQFDRKDDLDKYPGSLEQDLNLLADTNVDYVLAPTFNSLYPDNYNFKVSEHQFSTKLCGASRPGHFDGVLTIVLKLLNIVKPNKAYFGEKDYQQYQLIKEMTSAFFLNTQIIPCKTVREKSGLAFSSRNERLSEKEKRIAPKFAQLLNSNFS
jgi:pantoate--beta-alanine ligase